MFIQTTWYCNATFVAIVHLKGLSCVLTPIRLGDLYAEIRMQTKIWQVFGHICPLETAVSELEKDVIELSVNNNWCICGRNGNKLAVCRQAPKRKLIFRFQ